MVHYQFFLLVSYWTWALATVNGILITPRTYEILNVNTTCSSQQLKIRLEMNRKFQGVVYAKGFPLEKNCRSLGEGETFVDISIDTFGCGVRLASLDVSFIITTLIFMAFFYI